MRDLHFEYGASTVHRYQYEYDQAGNREYAWVQQWDWNAQDPSDPFNDSSFDYDYDSLRRLVFADMGALDDYGHIVNDPTIPLRRLSTWKLDNLGNWSGDDPNSFVRKDDSDGDGAWDDREFTHHATNSANEIDEFVTNGGGGAVATDFVHDVAGNLVFDGAYWYQYDAWNRLLQVNHAGTLSATDFLTNGQLDPEPGHEPGELVARFAYDGLGRLVHKQGTLDSGQLLKEDYYDAVRRVHARGPADKTEAFTGSAFVAIRFRLPSVGSPAPERTGVFDVPDERQPAGPIPLEAAAALDLWENQRADAVEPDRRVGPRCAIGRTSQRQQELEDRVFLRRKRVQLAPDPLQRLGQVVVGA